MDDVQLLVNSFYDKIQIDGMLGGIFHGHIKDWPTHLEKMYRFWQTLLLDEITYMSNSFEPHKNFPIDQKHFDRWMQLWKATIDEHFEGEKAEEAKMRAERIAMVFLSKIIHIREQKAAK